MDIEKLKKEDFTSEQSARGVPSIRFTKCGAIILSKSAVAHLKLNDAKTFGVVICKDKKDPCEFFITRDIAGWQLRPSGNGCMVFNNASLVHHILARTFEKCSHAADAIMPDSFTFRIAPKPLDDDKNKDVFALLRKK